MQGNYDDGFSYPHNDNDYLLEQQESFHHHQKSANFPGNSVRSLSNHYVFVFSCSSKNVEKIYFPWDAALQFQNIHEFSVSLTPSFSATKQRYLTNVFYLVYSQGYIFVF